ncbi:hypothetical protein RCL1_002953 [Eukaryota sp. TZLM3-RCL]
MKTSQTLPKVNKTFFNSSNVRTHKLLQKYSSVKLKKSLAEALNDFRTLQQRIKENPKTLQLVDSLSFFWGVIGLVALEFIFLSFPAFFPLVYVILLIPLVIVRYFIYRKLKYHYFVLDFCYFASVLNVVLLLAFPTSTLLFQICFFYAVGPLTVAINIWRNSYYPKLDNLTSLYLHIMPSLVMYNLKWRLPLGSSLPPRMLPSSFPAALLLYVLWQTFYLVATEVLSSSLKKDEMIMTSLRWIRKNAGKGTILGKVFGIFPTKLHWAVFAVIQICYTLLTMLPAFLIYRFKYLHVVLIVVSLVTSIYNGSQYHFRHYITRKT